MIIYGSTQETDFKLEFPVPDLIILGYFNLILKLRD